MTNADIVARRRIPRRFTGVVCLIATVLAVGACGGRDGTPGTAGAAPTAPRPVGVRDPAPSPADATSPAPAVPDSCDPRASLRPRGALPPPGQMPAGSPMAAIARRGRLVVGIDPDAYLFSFRDRAGGRLAGFEIDIIRAVAAAILGDPEAVQFRAITTAERIPVLQRGEVDLVVRTMTMTCQRREQVAFSTEYLSSGQRLLVRRGSGITDLSDLGGRKVCATNGSSSIPNIQREPSRPIAVATDLLIDCLVLLQQHQVDAVSSIDTLLATLAAQDPGTEIVGRRRTDDPSGIAMARDADALVRFVNGVLDRVRDGGAWRDSFARWLAPLGPPPPPPRPRYVD